METTSINKEAFQEYVELVINMALGYAPKVLLALITLIIGLWLIRRVIKLVHKAMEMRDVDPSLRGFLSGLVNIVLKVLLIISIAQMVGIETTSFIAVLGAAGLAIGLALQGSLGNFAGGVLILFFRPFRVGDFIETHEVTGTVQSINVLNTIITTMDNNTAVVPNGMVANNKLINYTKVEARRVDMIVGIGYKDDIDKAKQVIVDVLNSDELVLQDPPPFVGVIGLGDSSVDLAVRPHCKAEHYWDVWFNTFENVKKALDSNDVEIPYPQRDVHMKN